jgi:hypothetical protein
VLKEGSANAIASETQGAYRRCGRLFIWNCAKWQTVEGTPTYVVAEGCLSVVVTGKSPNSFRSAYGGPFYSDGPGAGSPLTSRPYWWPLCGGTGIGGWRLGSSWWRPTNANLRRIYEILSADVGAGMPAEGEPHTLILWIRFSRYDYGGGIGVPTTEEESLTRLFAAHITCPEVTEG